MILINKDIKVGFALTGSFCTFEQVFPIIKAMGEKYDVTPIVSEHVAGFDTRFIKSEETLKFLRESTGHEPIKSIPEAEPIGPKKLFSLLIVAPCTGNTLSKLANGITDTSVTMAVKAHLRNSRPVLLAVSSNDALSQSAKNIGMLLNMKNFYFVPLRQDDADKKPSSLVADFSLLEASAEMALEHRQIEPIIK